MAEKGFTINCIVLKGYRLHIDAESQEEAIEKVRAMTSKQIDEEGSLQYIDVDYVEPA